LPAIAAVIAIGLVLALVFTVDDRDSRPCARDFEQFYVGELTLEEYCDQADDR
jgi:hypothetical protein